MAKNTETCRMFATCLYIIVPNYSAFVGIYVVTCLTARSVDNCKRTEHLQRELGLQMDENLRKGAFSTGNIRQ
jgi:hypothetical protein